MARLLSRPIRSLRNALREIETGNFDCRISEARNDEFGQIFTDFNHMATTLEARNAEVAPSAE